MKRNFVIVFLFFICFTQTYGQVQPPDACEETDSLILARLNQWQDLKFGFMVHWGTYSQWGIVESWSVCSEDEDWISRDTNLPYDEYKQRYFALNKSFNPTKFNPQQWATLAQDAGMKYVVFTTKHHDGFCMFDTKQTSYSVTDNACPYSQNVNADITKAVVNAFKANNFWTGLYFSKPDWHNNDYWCNRWATPDRNVNYEIAKHKDKWKNFCDFTFKQIEELTLQYTPDILWLDGGWIRPAWSVNDESRPWLGCRQQVQDINMTKIANMIRQHRADILIIDRSVGGKYENYRTPEQQIPKTPLPYAWETCMTMGESWSYKPDDNYKSVNTLIHTLIEIVAKGGNLLLNVGPDSQGELPPQAIERMKAIGRWLSRNGYAIYDTHPVFPYQEGKICYTQTKQGQTFAIYLLDENEVLPDKISVLNNGKRQTLSVSKALQRESKGTNAVVFKLE
ncbi:MAG: alpha-L-fucosidase [Bacteroidales bacterium]|jgi:alpha-L-fucosidase|nr:alpha-L-fucosidase [Bacteroidales bacterium]